MSVDARTLFSRGRKIPKRNFRKNYRNDPTMKVLLENPAIARELNEPREQKELHRLMREKISGGLEKREMKEILNDLSVKHSGRHISTREAKVIDRQVIKKRPLPRLGRKKPINEGRLADSTLPDSPKKQSIRQIQINTYRFRKKQEKQVFGPKESPKDPGYYEVMRKIVTKGIG